MKPADSRARYDVCRNLQELIMMKWIGGAVVAGALALAAPASATTAQPPRAAKASDFSAQRHHRHYHRHYYHGYRPYYGRPYYQPYYRSYEPYYYGRPYYYRPYPYAVPAPFTFGFGFGSFW
jgi:hypothetical protein